MHRYEQTRDELVARLHVIEHALGEDRRATVTRARKRLESGKFVLAVVGEFSSGKSFLLNALLEKFRYEDAPGGEKRLVGLLATDINPSTATITELRHGEGDDATAVFEDGRTERIPLDRLNRFIAVGSAGPGKIHDATADERDAPTRVIVHSNSRFLERGFVVADTPGLASINPAHRRATLQFLPTADAVLYLIDTQQPFTEGDASFLGIVRQHIDSIFIVQTKIDLWQQPQSDGRPAWEHAYERISTMASVHAPGTYVYALSAREYVEGLLGGNEPAIAASRFPQFLAALDASLIRNTGRARLRRVSDRVGAAVADEVAQIEADLAMLSLDESALKERRARIIPALAALDKSALAQREQLLRKGLDTRTSLHQRAEQLADDLEAALAQGFDTADIARLRDRARLHIIVDRVMAAVVDEFARQAARDVVDQIDEALSRSEALLPFRFSTNDAAARSFEAHPGTSLWSGDVKAAIAATIVLEAIGGPAIGLVHDIATRFTSRPPGEYMKRELIADLRAEIFPRFRTEVNAFGERIGARLQRIFDELAQTVAGAVVAKRDADIGSIDRALGAHQLNKADELRAKLERDSESLENERAAVSAIVDGFMQRDEEIAPADPGHAAVRLAHAATDSAFDPTMYNQGLRPSRWRVAVLGALRRGKTSLINSIAGMTVLTDDIAASARFPIHVRYGEKPAAYALGEGGAWNDIPFESATAEAAKAPVLVLVPWTMPRELVLVHAPAFDSGDPAAEDVNVVVAANASEVLCLFSRQLSDRELSLYERVAEFNKPMIFAHTIADNESANERRGVVELAQTYLEERKIPAQRVFVLSAHEYDEAKKASRAAAAWNEVEALRTTLEGHAESHMARLERLARAVAPAARATAPEATQDKERTGFFNRLFGKGR